jgi:hypothetical protein
LPPFGSSCVGLLSLVAFVFFKSNGRTTWKFPAINREKPLSSVGYKKKKSGWKNVFPAWRERFLLGRKFVRAQERCQEGKTRG